MQGFKNYKGLYGDQQDPFWKTEIHIEPLQKRNQLYNYEITEHLHTNLIQIFLLEKGEGLLRSEGRQVRLESPCLSLIPNGVLHGFSSEPTIHGLVVTISLPYYEASLLQLTNVSMYFGQLRHYSFAKDDQGFKAISSLIKELSNEIEQQQAEKNAVIQLLYKLLMLKLYRLGVATQPQVISSDHRMLIHFNAFQRAISQHLQNPKSVQAYAKTLNITAVHLNRICQTLMQKSALQLIHEKVIIEARKQLRHSDSTIAEVAYALHFKDPSNFSKFFKRHVGVSPRRFRQQHV
ncbi:MAG: AraC family transcriptional regulator [Saprospiraceae bacterium]|nr:AraC family transcriptional regulator [Saprospiraceae bacterium]